ncbi:hypothetical protein L682_22105 [Aquipseudomonas alcaligenes OT 69]|nr:hypothetical protein L682_22105 [Pseudomonas alcaligenes OT 69]
MVFLLGLMGRTYSENAGPSQDARGGMGAGRQLFL